MRLENPITWQDMKQKQVTGSVILVMMVDSHYSFQVAIVDEKGSVKITWVDRTVSNVKPQELYRVDPEVRIVWHASGNCCCCCCRCRVVVVVDVCCCCCCVVVVVMLLLCCCCCCCRVVDVVLLLLLVVVVVFLSCVFTMDTCIEVKEIYMIFIIYTSRHGYTVLKLINNSRS